MVINLMHFYISHAENVMAKVLRVFWMKTIVLNKKKEEKHHFHCANDKFAHSVSCFIDKLADGYTHIYGKSSSYIYFIKQIS